MSTRMEVHSAFMCDNIKIIVATVAFGMGIDKANIRCILHFGLPKAIEQYYQQVGRAGRDASLSVCLLYYHNNDLSFKVFFLYIYFFFL
jgi:superfamily II DNA helicase RecQ